MSGNLANAFFLLEFNFKLFGLGNFEHQNLGQLNVFFTYVYKIISWIVIFSISIYLLYHRIIGKEPAGFIVINSQLFTTFTMVICFLYYKKTWKRCFDRIVIINDTLEKLYIPNNYENLRRRIKRNIIIWIVISTLINIIQLLWYQESLNEIIIYLKIFIINHPLCVNNLADLKYEIFIWYTTTIFEEINKYILHLSTNNNHELKVTPASVNFKRSNYRYLIDTFHHKHTLLTIMHVHLELSKTCYEFHKMFQVQLTIGMISQFILILGYLLLVDIHFSFKFSYLLIIMPAFFLLVILTGKVIFLNNTIEKCCKEAKRTEHALHILRDFTYDPERREEILQFILQIGQKLLKLSGMGLFNFGHHFAYKYIMTLLDCIIIIEQLNNFSNYSL